MAEAQHQDLSAAFAAPAKGKDRAAALSGLLAPKQKPATESAASSALTDPPDAHATLPTTATTRERSRRDPQGAPRPRTAARAETKPAADQVVNLPVYLPEDLRAQMQAAMPRGTTYADVLTEAFEGTTEERLAQYFTPTPRTSASGMPLPPQVPNPGTGPQRQFRVSQAQLDWISQLVDRVNAPNRSVLCVAVLRLHFEDRTSTHEAR